MEVLGRESEGAWLMSWATSTRILGDDKTQSGSRISALSAPKIGIICRVGQSVSKQRFAAATPTWDTGFAFCETAL